MVRAVTGLRAARTLALMLMLGALLLERSATATVWPSSHQRVADALTSGDTGERRSAAALLGTLPPALARKLARQGLRDADVEVRVLSARVAAMVGVDKAGDEVVSWLSDADVRIRVAACELIEAAPTPPSVQALARVLGDAQPAVRGAAASALGSSGMADAATALLGHLDDGSSAVRLEIVRALGRLGDGRAVVPLVSKLQDLEPEVRREAARALSQLGDSRANATLMLALQDPSVEVRVQVLDALGKLRAADVVAAIAALFTADGGGPLGSSSAHGPVHDAALAALGRIATPEAIKLLIDALEREGPVPIAGLAQFYGSGPKGSASFRGSGPELAPVRDALSEAGQPAAVALTTLVDAAASPRLGAAAALALASLHAKDSLGANGPSGAAAVTAVMRAAQRGAIALDAALGALSLLGDKRALPYVLEHLDASDARIRHAVVRAALTLTDPREADGRVVDVVRARARDLRVPLGERILLIKLLGRSGSPRALPLLLPLAKSKPLAVKMAAVDALGTLGVASREVDAVLLEALEAPSERLRIAAADAIASVGKDAAAHALLHELGVSAEGDRGAIGVALSGALARSTDPKLVSAVGRAMASAPATARDSLIEGLGRMRAKQAGAVLGRLRRHADLDDRRKIAEALAGHPDSEATLVSLAHDPDPSVRANAAWSLGHVGGAVSVPVLERLLADLDAAVAGNAAVALAQAASRTGKGSDAARALCRALGDYRPYVRAGSLVGLRLGGGRCPQVDAVTQVLRRDRSWRVRMAAADLLRRARSDPGVDVVAIDRALSRCGAEDRDALVAERCGRDAPRSKGAHDVTVYVVPDGSTAPSPRAPFALVLADGSMRLGVTDRRGALFERRAPSGPIELAVPAALAR